MTTTPPVPIAVAMPADVYAAYFDAARDQFLRSTYRIVGELAQTSAGVFTPEAAEAKVLLTAWHSPVLTAEFLAQFPNLELVIHCAGSIRSIVTPEIWRRNIAITSSATANAVPVAEYTLGAILLSGKRAHYYARIGAENGASWEQLVKQPRMSNYERTVGILGFSRIGKLVVELLRTFDGIDVLVADPYADPQAVRNCGATLVTLEEMLPRADVLSIHAPDLPATYRMIGASELAALPNGATVINTARGKLLDTDALIVECASGRLDAIIDVTDPEPLPADSPLYDLPNVMVTPHIAGSMGSEISRLTDMALGELARYAGGMPLVYQVTEADMAVRA